MEALRSTGKKQRMGSCVDKETDQIILISVSHLLYI